MDPASVRDRLRELESLSRDQLVARWETVFGHPAPPKVRAPLLRGALAWQLQMDASDWTPTRIGRALRLACAPTGALVQPGSTLVREWQGRTYAVQVMAGGYLFEGETHRSLTAIATRITGTPWSGPKFFGLKP